MRSPFSEHSLAALAGVAAMAPITRAAAARTDKGLSLRISWVHSPTVTPPQSAGEYRSLPPGIRLEYPASVARASDSDDSCAGTSGNGLRLRTEPRAVMPTNETNADAPPHRGRERQDAEGLPLCLHGAGRAQLRSRVQARADAGRDAPPRRLRRQVHDGCDKGIPEKLVQARQALARRARLPAQLLRRRREPAAVGVAAQGLDPPRRPARLVPVVLPLLHGPAPARGGQAPDQALEGDPPARGADQEQLRAGRHDAAAGASARRCCTGPTTARKI